MLKTKWGLVLMVLVLGLALVVSGCGGKEPAKGGSGEKVIKVGFVAPLTGDVKTFGESSKKGFYLALEQANYKAGDWKIEPVEVDDRNEVTEATNVANKLVSQDKVKAIVGSLTTKATLPISQIANENKVVLITGTATNEKVTVDNNKRKEFIFRACFIDPFQTKVMSKFALETLKAKTAVILYDQSNDYTVGMANHFKEDFTSGGGQVLDMLAYSTNDTDFSAILTNVAQKNPDVLFLPDYYQKVSLIGKQAREKGIKAIFLGGDGWDSSELDYATMDGGYFTNHYSADENRPEVKAWVDLYKKKYNTTPDAFATLTYDATNLLLNAIKTANSDDPAKIREAMQNTKDFVGVSGKISFDQNGNPIKPLAILQVKGGKQTYVTSITP